MAVDSSIIRPSQFNPLADNRFETRQNVVEACNGLFTPLLPYFSPGRARVQIDASASTWDRAASDLEGWARPLFGIVPMVAGGGSFAHWNIYREGLKNGTDPHHPEYWGPAGDFDQRHVEATGIGLALLLVPEHIWEPLEATTKDNVAEWLITNRNGLYPSNNQMFFRVFVDLGLRKIGRSVDQSMTEDYLQRIENLYIRDGWYRDGNDKGDSSRIDYYNPWAMHYYGLLYARYCPEDKARASRFKERARIFARQFQHWFADTGANVPYGRSLVYRHCAVAFWGALALVDVEALPWGVMKGLYLRNLRWWSTQPISRNGDGLLISGYAYPNQLISERYSSSGSPWWSMKAFLPLALSPNHPFWAAEELELKDRRPVVASPVSGMVFTHQPNHTILLVAGSETGQQMRGIPEKYKKFAYSTRYGFSVESDALGFKTGAFDSMIAFSDDNTHYRVREHCAKAAMAGDKLYSLWYPWNDVQVETWSIPHGPWHIRIHRILSERNLSTIEGGFAAPRTDFNKDQRCVEDTSAWVMSELGDFSGVLDASEPRRTARVVAPHGNTNVMFPRTLVPQLQGVVKAGTPTTLACAILAGPDGRLMRSNFSSIPEIPSVLECESIFVRNGHEIEVCRDD